MSVAPVSRTTHTAVVRHFAFYIGAGGMALGLDRAHARVGRLSSKMECLGGIDIDPAACRDAERFLGVPIVCRDLFTREQYIAFHGHAPPSEWREVTADDVRAAAQGRRPHIVEFSAPCKAFSGLNSAARAGSRKYQALNELVLRGIELMLEAWGDDPPELLILENVPLIATRGRELLDDVRHLLEMAGYSVAETTHDCGELGGLAQHRKRFLLVARYRAKVPPFLYEPPKLRVRGVGEVLGALPMPDDLRGGPMHRLPRLKWLTQVRLALIPAGEDWRALAKLDVVDGYVRGLGIVPRDAGWHGGVLGVRPWDEPSGTIAGESSPTNGEFAVADPRCPPEWAGKRGGFGQYGVVDWANTAHTVTAKVAAGSGPHNVADPRIAKIGDWAHMRVEGWADPAHTITASGRHVECGALSVADPRLACDASDTQHRRYNNVYRVVRWDSPSQAVTSGAAPSGGGQAVADPRLGMDPERANYATAGHYGVRRWDEPTGAVTSAGQYDNGANSVADPRVLPAADDASPAVIVSLDGTWHRPFTTLECAALQGLPVLDEDRAALVLDGDSHSAWRERIGNMCPPPSMEAAGCEFVRTLLMAWSGQKFALSNTPIWVRDVAIALSVSA